MTAIHPLNNSQLQSNVNAASYTLTNVVDPSSDQDAATKKYVDDNDVVNPITSTAVIADDTIVRGNGGARGIQDTGISIDDSDNITGITTIECGMITTSSNMAVFSNGSGWYLTDLIEDEDIIFRVNDGGVGTNMVTFDASVPETVFHENIVYPAHAFMAVMGSDQNNVADGTILAFNTVEQDTDNAFDTANYKYVIPIEGFWQINAMYRLQGMTANNKRGDIGLVVDETANVLRMSAYSNDASPNYLSISGIVYLTVGQEIKIRIGHNDDGTQDVTVFPAKFSGAYLGS